MIPSLGVIAASGPTGPDYLYVEDWSGADNAAWSGDWATSGDTGNSADIQANEGRQQTGGAGGYGGNVSSVLDDLLLTDADFELTVDLTIDSNETFYRIMYRGDDTFGNGGYAVQLVPIYSNAGFFTISGWAYTGIGLNYKHYTSSGDVIHVRLRVEGSAHKLNLWNNADPEPAGWVNETTDTTKTGAGRFFLGMAGGSPAVQNVAVWDNLKIAAVT